ncbi:F-box/LRR-repeat protein 2-like [Aphidius gifuensis]|uniref:F-box/LRR-repeat protein 2-like n=1 Tax=Aphidius gifuensis TaxID=684658 RepID=UPI001CDC3F46|nr:F-box/LRR-repeat protein 2-like [Aphidius gifuensis]
MVDTCSICSTKTFHLTSLFVTDDGKKWRDSGLLKMVEVCKRIKIIKSVKKIPMICNPCIYKISKSFYNINNHKNHQDKRTVVCETIKSSDESKIPAVEENKNTDYIKEKSQLNKRPRNESHDNAIRKKLCQRNEEIIEPVIKQDLINNLDNDCLAKIFLYLPTIELFYIEQVCQRWKLVVQLAWQDTKKYIDNLYKNCNLLKQLHIEKIINRCGHHLNHLVLSKNCDSSIIKIIADNCHNLVRLELKFKTINENNFTRVFSRMAKLKVIKIEDNRDRFNTNDHITHILDSIPEGIEEIFFHSACNVLQISHKFSSAFEHFNAIRLISLQHCEFGLDLMQKISLKKTIIYIDFEKSVLKSGLPLLSNLINLKHLNLDFVMGCTSEALVHITDECKNIKCSRCTNITDCGIMFVIQNCHNLEDLRVDETGVTDKSIHCALNNVEKN